MSVQFRIAADETGRVDKAIVRRYPDTGRRALTRMFRAGRVRINGTKAAKGDKVVAGSEVLLDFDPNPRATVTPIDDATVTCVFEDAHLIAINKPAGVPSHPLAADETGTAANVIVARYPNCATASDDPREAGLVHRLDTFTSGVLLAARDQQTWRAARQLFSDKAVDKTYLALVNGIVDEAGSCNARLSRTGGHVRPAVDGLPATTIWQVIEHFAEHTLVACKTQHGRRHQVRVHLAHCGHPLAGDTQYGGASLPGLTGQFLHADKVVLIHPHSGDQLTIEAPLSQSQQALLASLR